MSAALVVAACGSPAPSPAEPTPVPDEPCEVNMLEPGLAAMADAAGYRFSHTLEMQQLAMPTNLNNPTYVWVTDRGTGAYLAPDRGREEIVAGRPGRPNIGYDALLTVGPRTWMYVRRDDAWSEVDIQLPPNRADAFNVAFGGQPIPWVVVDDVEGLLGEGGCVLAASVSQGREEFTLSVRIDPVAGRVFAWQMSQLQADPDEGGGVRQSMEIEYVLPDEREFQPPGTFEPLGP